MFRRLQLRQYATASRLSSMKPVNLKLVLSNFLLRVHPDVVQAHTRNVIDVHTSVREKNEESLKTLNAFLDIASAGCNGEAITNESDVNAFPLEFYIPMSRKTQRKAKEKDHIVLDGQLYTKIEKKIEISQDIMEASYKAQTNLRSIDLSAVYWRIFTNSIFRDLFTQAEIKITSSHLNGELIPWDEEKIREAETEKVFASQISFEKKFKAMLTRERNIVFKLTTGYEEDAGKHRVLLDLLGRTHVDSLPEDDRPNAFNWVGEILLRHFMELRLANPVWNRVAIIMTDTEDVYEVMEDERSIAFVIGFTHDVDKMVEFMGEQVAKLEAELDAHTNSQPKRKQLKSKPKRLY